jgi:hypothetical protein
MSLPRDLWPGPGSWQMGPPSEEQHAGVPLDVRPEDELFPKQDRQNVAPPRVTLLRRMMSWLPGRHRRNGRG